MPQKVTADCLAAVYDALLSEPPTSGRKGERRLTRFADEGWVLVHQAEDYFYDVDARVMNLRGRADLEELGRAFEVPVQQVTYRPSALSRTASVFTAWSALDFASLLVGLQSLGFAVDPLPLIEALRPTLPKSGIVPRAALDVIWYKAQAHKSIVTLDADTRPPLHDIKQHRLANGYRLEAWVSEAGAPSRLEIKGPKHRAYKQPVSTVCAECGETWMRGDPESSAMHRREHKRRMSYLDPQPDRRVLKEMAAGAFDEHVDRWSPAWRQEAMYLRAFAFKREEHYDFIQWSTSEDDLNAHGFLFADPEGRIVGACAFRLRCRDGRAHRWGLQWVWVSPDHRRSGVLRSRWRGLRERFGDFDVEWPVSDAMKAFVAAVGDDHLLTDIEAPAMGTERLAPILTAYR